MYLSDSENVDAVREAKIESNIDIWRAFGTMSETFLGVHSYPTPKECELLFDGLVPCMTRLVRDYFDPRAGEHIYKQVKKFANNLSEFFGSVGQEVGPLGMNLLCLIQAVHPAHTLLTSVVALFL